jgi:hypothetical protein
MRLFGNALQNYFGSIAVQAPSQTAALTAIANTSGSAMRVANATDSSISFLSSGVSKGIRFEHAPAGSTIDGVDFTGSGSFQPLAVQGSTLSFNVGSATTTAAMTVAASGAVVVLPPTGANAALAVTGNGNTALSVDAASGSVIGFLNSNNASGGALQFTRGGIAKGYLGNSAFLGGSLDNMALRSETGFGIDFITSSGSHVAGTISSVGGWQLNTPVSGETLALFGAAAAYALAANGSASTGNSFGLLVSAGTTAADAALTVNNQSNATTYFQVNGVGSVTVGSPTGGGQGIGTVNATGLFVNGAAVLTSVGSINANSLTGTTLASGVVNSSLTSVGTVTSGSFPAANLSGTTLAAGVTASSLTSVGTLSSVTVSGASQEGSTVVGSPTGGNKGAGSINAQSIFLNGVAVGGSSFPVAVKVKSAATGRTSATLSNDPDLTFAITTAGTYKVEVLMQVGTSPSAGFAFNLNYSGTIANSVYDGLVTVGTLINAVGGNVAGSPATVLNTLGAAGITYATIEAVVVVSTAGTVALSWGVNNSTGATCSLSAGSTMIVTQIA